MRSAEPTRGRGTALPRHCSIGASRPAIDTIIARSPRAAIGMFRCPVDHPSFRDSGAISECIVVFPRTSVWIRHEGSSRFFADPNTVTMYNRAQRYERFRHSDAGDRCDWFGVADDVAREIAGAFEPSMGESDRPFRFERGPSTAPLYLRQRTLLTRADRGEVDRLMLEEEVFGIVASALALSYHQRPQKLERDERSTRRRRELADAARAELVAAPHVNYAVHDLAHRLHCSPFHLCRVFRACTGKTMHQYRTEHRLRLALEGFEGTVGNQQNLSRVAHDLGFASHAHFVRAARQYFGATPSAVRRALAGGPMHS